MRLLSYFHSVIFVIACVFFGVTTANNASKIIHEKSNYHSFFKKPMIGQLIKQQSYLANKYQTSDAKQSNAVVFRIISLQSGITALLLAYLIFFVRGVLGIGKFSFAKTFNVLRVYKALSNSEKLTQLGYTEQNKLKVKFGLMLLIPVYVFLMVGILLNAVYLIVYPSYTMIDLLIILSTPMIFIFIPKLFLNNDIIDTVVKVNQGESDFPAPFPHVELIE